MDHDSSFLALIQADLDDDAPRLVYADWLQQKNARYGHFLAASCALEAHLRASATGEGIPLRELRSLAPSSERTRLASRVHQLLKRNAKAWEAELRELTDRIAWRRGFVEGLGIDIADVGSPILERAPCLVELSVRLDAPERLQEILDAPVLARLRRLFLDGSSREEAAPRTPAFATDPEAPLRTLGLSVPATWLPWLHRFLGLRACRDLEELSLGGALTFQPLRSVLDQVAPLLGNVRAPLRRLHVGHLQLGPAGYRALGRTPWLSNLEVLGAVDTALDDAAGAELVRALPRLRAADLSGNQLREATARALLERADPAKLRHLDLRGNLIPAEWRDRLATAFGDAVAL